MKKTWAVDHLKNLLRASRFFRWPRTGGPPKAGKTVSSEVWEAFQEGQSVPLGRAFVQNSCSGGAVVSDCLGPCRPTCQIRVEQLFIDINSMYYQKER